MAKMTIKNTTKSPRGFYNEKGAVVTVAPGETAEADLKEAPIGFEKVTAKAATADKE